MNPRISRRALVRQVVYDAASGYLVMAAGACGKRGQDPVTLRRAGGLVLLTGSELETVAAAAERIFPRDADPGAIDLGVPGYIDKALATEDFRDWRTPFRQALARLDQDARKRFGGRFCQRPYLDQDALLMRWDLEGDVQQRRFFGNLVFLTLEGVFGNPSHGGNRDGAGWRMVGFEP